MKFLVTGGAGFIGSHIVDELINCGHEVVVVDDLSSGKEENIHGKVKFFRMDIRDERLRSLFKKENPEYVCHLAAQMDVRRSVSDPIFDAQVNVLGTLNVIQCCVEYDVKKILFSSTGGAIYGEQDVFPASESHPIKPLSPYGISKRVAEQYLHYFKYSHGLDYVSLRYSNVYGPRQDPYGE
ncbi:MAG: NAD-dependent epimerase/dehydratase family protein, partial [Nitrospirota bacterium]